MVKLDLESWIFNAFSDFWSPLCIFTEDKYYPLSAFSQKWTIVLKASRWNQMFKETNDKW